MRNKIQLLTTSILSIFLHIFFTSSFASNTNFTYSHGAIIRGNASKKEIALVFTGDTYADGADHIIKVLKHENIKASFFLTGNFYREKGFAKIIKILKSNNHYLGAHSDQHLLCCEWKNRNTLLVSKKVFLDDILNNYHEMNKFGILAHHAKYFLPSYEWHNDKTSAWTTEIGFTLINFTPGTRSNEDYTTPDMKNYVSSKAIQKNILDYEKTHLHGLNGFILLLHIGTAPERQDKFYLHLSDLITELKKRNYSFVKIDKLLD